MKHNKQFRDCYNQPCGINTSSLATKPAIWLGVVQHKMLLDKRQAKMIANRLLKWVKEN